MSNNRIAAELAWAELVAVAPREILLSGNELVGLIAVLTAFLADTHFVGDRQVTAFEAFTIGRLRRRLIDEANRIGPNVKAMIADSFCQAKNERVSDGKISTQRGAR